jgi:hypothetical protein
MQRLVAVALATCNTVYIIVIVCSGLVFGADLEADVLANVNSAAMAPLVGPATAAAMAALVRVGYLLSLIGSYVLLCYPLRQVCMFDGQDSSSSDSAAAVFCCVWVNLRCRMVVKIGWGQRHAETLRAAVAEAMAAAAAAAAAAFGWTRGMLKH